MNYKIEKLKNEELSETLKLVTRVFDEFEKPDYSEEGVNSFYKFANFDNISKCLKENFEIYVAKVENKIVGMICVKDRQHINLLFVDKEYHRNGIAKNLVEKVKSISQVNFLTLNSSPYAIDFYHKIGFKDESEMQEIDGIKFVPMKLNF